MIGDYGKFKKSIYDLTQIDLSAYKESQMRRRIDSLITKNNALSYDAYVDLIKKDRKKFEQFVNYLTINVSEFYRDAGQWKVMQEKAVPELIQRFGKNLRIWSAACSTGDEPYSIVMELSRYLPMYQIRVLATDIDKQVLDAARMGIYSEKSIHNVPPEFKRKYFKQVGSSYQISNEIKSHVEFREHNLLKDAYPSNCHMIVCRNVMIYFTEEAKVDLYKKFNQSLVKDGLLFIGSAEQILDYRSLNYNRKNACFFSKL